MSAFCARIANLHADVWHSSRYGPGDQGAINYFYEAAIKSHRLDSQFNTKPYHPWKKAAKIVHFHGPKPHDFLSYMRTGECAFHDYCQTGLSSGFCIYATEWAGFITDEPLGQQVLAACHLHDAAHTGHQRQGASSKASTQDASLSGDILTTLQDLGLDDLL